MGKKLKPEATLPYLEVYPENIHQALALQRIAGRRGTRVLTDADKQRVQAAQDRRERRNAVRYAPLAAAA